MKIILPVAGKGTRLRPHTNTKAKSLVRVAGKTVLEHIIGRLIPLSVEEFVFIVDENGSQIEAFMTDNFPSLPCRYVVQNERKGPAHAISLAAPHIESGDNLLIVFNDTIFDADLTNLGYLSQDCDGLIFSKEVEDYKRFGVNVVRNGFIADMVEKPDTPISKLAQVGLYYLKDGHNFMRFLERSICAGETVKGEYYLPPVFMRMIKEGYVFKAPEIDAWLDCGKPETLLETNRYLLNGGYHVHGETFDSVLIDPVYIERGAMVRSSVLGPNVSIAAGSVVEGSVVQNSIINSDSVVRNMILRDSILGDSVCLAGSPRQLNIGDHSIIELPAQM